MKTLNKTLFYLLAVLLMIPAGYPLYFLIVSSFKTTGDYTKSIFGLPSEFYLGNYETVLSGRFLIYLKNSVVVAVVSLTILIIVTSMASYVLSRIQFRLRGAVFTFFLAGMMIPVHSTLIPIYMLTNKIGLYDSIWGLIGPYVAVNIPISILIMTGFFRSVPKEIEEAAMIDGASHLQCYWHILLPISKPAVATVAIYNFLNIWNEFIYALVLINSSDQMTLPLGIKEFYGKLSVNYPGILTVVLMGTLPMIVFFILAQEKVIHSMAAGAVKG